MGANPVIPSFGYSHLPPGAVSMLNCNLSSPQLNVPHISGPKAGKGEKKSQPKADYLVGQLGEKLSNLNIQPPPPHEPPGFKKLRG